MQIEEKTVIEGFECELDFSEEWSDCYVVKGSYSGTLQFLMSYGFIESTKGMNQLEVPLRVINKIEKWALANGY
jgi:hypothetical protein